MKAILAAALALLVAGCATVRSPGDEHWLVGRWILMEEDIEFPLACDSDLPIAYSASGRYDLLEEYGRWRLEGTRLTETKLGETDAGPGEPSGTVSISTLRREGADAFTKFFSNGSPALFRRCP